MVSVIFYLLLAGRVVGKTATVVVTVLSSVTVVTVE